MKRIISLITILCMIASLFVACVEDLDTSDDQNKKEDEMTYATLISKADEYLADNSYKATLTYTFDCDNEELNAIYSMMNMSTDVSMKGQNFTTVMTVMGMEMNIVCVDNVLYYNIPAAEMKVKADIGSQMDEILENYGKVDSGAEVADFADIKLEETDGKYKISCSGLNADALNELMGEMGLADQGLTVDAIEYDVIIDGDKYESMDMSITMTMTVEGMSITVTVAVTSEYSYENIADIVAPADADSYEEVPLDEILGE